MSFYALRDGYENDHAYVIDTWMKCNAQSRMALEAGSLYAAEQKRLNYRIILSQATRVIVAHDPNNVDGIIGYAVGKPGDEPVVYYVYVRKDARRLGVACAMLGRLLCLSPKDLSCRTIQYSHKPMQPSLKPPTTWKFNPYRNLDSDALPAVKS